MWGPVLLIYEIEPTEPVWFLLKTNTVFFFYVFPHKSMMVRHQEATNQQILKCTCTDDQSSSPHTRVHQF